MSGEGSDYRIAGRSGAWEIAVGLEVHAQAISQAKLFSTAPTAFGAEPNSQVSLVDAAMPGMLPVINGHCVAQAVRTGLALEAEINLTSVFDRKNYFYPDLPPGYQISQFSRPIVGKGRVVLDLDDGSQRTIGITRLHLEMDAGKSIHDRRADATCVDLNRAGIALMEIVSEPDIRSPEEAGLYLRKLRSILRYIGTCDGNMEQGSLRADVNVSVRRPGGELGTRCEVKNLNSVRFVMRAIEIEAERQVAVLEDGGAIELETRLFDAERGETRSMRSKEEAHDYRYFPDPDLLPLTSTPPGWRPSAPGCRSCPTPGRHASCGTMASRPTTPACSWRNARSPSFSRKSRPAETASRWPTGSRACSSPRSTAPGSGSSRARFRRLPSAR